MKRSLFHLKTKCTNYSKKSPSLIHYNYSLKIYLKKVLYSHLVTISISSCLSDDNVAKGEFNA